MSFFTWNMQGASHSTENKWNMGVLPMFAQGGADVVCLQECGGVPASAVPVVAPPFALPPGVQLLTWGTLRTRKYILFYPSDPNGNRCNLAVVTRALPTAAALVWPAAGPSWRPALGAQVGGGPYFFSIHAISPGGPDATGLLAAIAGMGGASCVLGDYNRAPGTFALPAGWAFCPPNGPTYPATGPVATYDYLTNNAGYVAGGTVQGFYLSDHLAVAYP